MEGCDPYRFVQEKTDILAATFQNVFEKIPVGKFALIIIYDGRVFQKELEKLHFNCKCPELAPVLMIGKSNY